MPIKESWLESGSVYGYRKVCDDLRELSEQCGINRVHRLMRSARIRSQTGLRQAQVQTWRRAVASGSESSAAAV